MPTMTPIRRPRTLRRIATAMLLFWLFAIGASWANACVLQNQQTHAHADAVEGDHAFSTVTAGHGGAVPSHADDGDAGDLVCLDLCDAASQSCVQPDGAPGAVDLTDGPPLLLAAAWAPVAARVADVPVVATAPLPDAVPPRTRLSRLAL